MNGSTLLNYARFHDDDEGILWPYSWAATSHDPALSYSESKIPTSFSTGSEAR